MLTHEDIRAIINLTNELLGDFAMGCYYNIEECELCIVGHEGKYYTRITTRERKKFIHKLSQSCIAAISCEQCEVGSSRFMILSGGFKLRYKEA